MNKITEIAVKNTLKRLSERKAVSIRMFKSDIPEIQKIAFKE